MQAKDVMSAPVFTVTTFTRVRELAAMLVDRHIGGVPVLECGRVVGMVSESDFLHRHEIGTDRRGRPQAWWRRLVRPDSLPDDYVKSRGQRVRDVMTRPVISVQEGTPLASVASLLESRGIRRVPVLRGMRLVGIITRSDLVRAFNLASGASVSAETTTDDSILQRLLLELGRQPWWRSQWSSVYVVGGIVFFRGLVESESERRAAHVAAENLPGVRGVEDDRMNMPLWQPMV